MHKGRKKSRRFKRSHGGNITERKKKVEFEQTKTNKKKKKPLKAFPNIRVCSRFQIIVHV